MDLEEDLRLYHQHHREFRFDLSRIPPGETVTAAELRIYKDFVHERYENETFRVSVFQVLQQQPKRYVIINTCRSVLDILQNITCSTVHDSVVHGIPKCN